MSTFSEILNSLDAEKKDLILRKVIDISKYKVGSHIGYGSFGNVLFAIEKETNNKYASKILKYSLDSEQFRIDEVLISSMVSYPCLLSLIGFSPVDFYDNPNPTFIFPYMKNGSLDKFFQNFQKDNTKIFIILLGIAIGMEHLHSIDIVHRDLKPANILLDDNFYPHITDFGYSKLVDKDDILSTFAGSPAYMPPEIIRSECYTSSVDVYSYSIMAYQLLTGQSPYPKQENVYQFMQNISKGLRPDLSCVTNQTVREFLEQSWSDNPSQRPSFTQIIEYILQYDFYKDFDIQINEVIKFLEIFGTQFDGYKKKLTNNIPKGIILSDNEEYSESSSSGELSSFKNGENSIEEWNSDDLSIEGLSHEDWRIIRQKISEEDYSNFVSWLKDYESKPKPESNPQREEFIQKAMKQSDVSRKVVEILYDFSNDPSNGQILVLSNSTYSLSNNTSLEE